MEELYWITRLDGIRSCICVLAVTTLLYPCALLMAQTCDEKIYNTMKKYYKWVIMLCAMCTIGAIMIPSTKEMLFIYGVGGAIDHIENNEKAQQLPDKCIEALDAFIESLNNENTNK